MRFMGLPPLEPGYIWVDCAPLCAGYCDWQQKPAPCDWNRSTQDIVADGDKLFGYEPSELLAKQYIYR